MTIDYKNKILFKKYIQNDISTIKSRKNLLISKFYRKCSTASRKKTAWSLFTAVIGVVVGGLTAWIALLELQSKQDRMFISINQDKSCNVSERGGLLELCWEAYIINRSLSKTSLVALDEVPGLVPSNLSTVEEIQEWIIFEVGGYFNFYDDSGKKVSLPITLDGGEARKYKAKMYVKLPPKAIHAAQAIYSHYKSDLFNKTLQEYEMEMIWKFKVDLLGRTWEGGDDSRTISENYKHKRLRIQLKAITSRGEGEITDIYWY